MKKDSGIEIKIENKLEIERFLVKVNGRAKKYAFTTANEIIQLSRDAESELESLGLVKSNRKGAKYWAESAWPVAKSYKYKRIGTNVTLVRKKDCWVLSHAVTYDFDPTQGGKTKVFVTKNQADYLVRKFSKRYTIIT